MSFIDNRERPVATTMTFEFTPDATLTLADKKVVKPVSALEGGDKVVLLYGTSATHKLPQPAGITQKLAAWLALEK